jgi:hypothetical protein
MGTCPTRGNRSNLPAEVERSAVPMSRAAACLRICPTARLPLQATQAASAQRITRAKGLSGTSQGSSSVHFESEFVAYEKMARAVKLPMKSTDNKAGLQKGNQTMHQPIIIDHLLAALHAFAALFF